MAAQYSAQTPRVGLVLPGGGARNAYQAGALKAIAELLPKHSCTPFTIICGTSAGAINAAMLASYAGRFQDGVRHMLGLWGNLHAGMVYRTDLWTALANSWRWFAAIALGKMAKGKSTCLLDNTPLRNLLESHLRLARIQQAIDSGLLRAVAINAAGYYSGYSTSFYQGASDIVPWQRTHRRGLATEIRLDHIMASIAIPFVFPAIRIRNEYHGDGSMRETAPLSPALHLGAERLLVIAVRMQTAAPESDDSDRTVYPSFGHIAGYVLDTLFMDTLDADVEGMERINRIVLRCQRSAEHDLATADREADSFRSVDLLILSPQRDLRDLVPKHMPSFPRSVRFLLRAMGATTPEGRALVTYLLFERSFCLELIDWGYQDTMQRKNEILALLER